jgi:hypothetical protein
MAKNYVCNGAKIECKLCTKPEGELKVTSNEIQIQDKLFANAKDKEKVNLIFQGNCKKSPYQASPCAAVIKVGDWQGVADALIQDEPALLEDSTIMCTYGGAPIKITDDLQVSELTELLPTDVAGITPDVQPKMLIQSATNIPEKKPQTTLKRKIRNADEEQENCYAIETIEILDLDEGSDNKGNGGTEEGMIYGKEYKLKVKKYFDNKKPKDLETINWGFTYDPEDGSVVVGAFKEKGEEVTFKADDLELCGKMIIFYAYIENKEQEASLEVPHHYRFRWFDKSKISSQLSRRKYSPWDIDQGGSSLCGVAIVGYYLARDNFDVYKSFVENMHSKGEATFNNTNYKVEIDSDEHLLNYKTTDKEYPTKSDYSYTTKSYPPIEEIDFVFMLTIKDYLNDVWDYDPNNESSGGTVEGTTGLTLPFEIKQMFKNINGYSTIENDTNLVTSKWSKASKSASKLKGLLSNKENIALLISADNFTKNSKPRVTVPTHWVGLQAIKDDTKNKEITVTVYTWSKKRKQWTVSYDAFVDGYFGYVSGK